jgi:transcriptional regulator with XRE-family HTH domain
VLTKVVYTQIGGVKVDILELVGNRIREIRLERGLTQEEVGEAVGVSYSYIGRIERGQKNISLQTLSKIAHALNVSESDLFAYTGKFSFETKNELEIKEILSVLARQDLQNLTKAKNILFDTLKHLNNS